MNRLTLAQRIQLQIGAVIAVVILGISVLAYQFSLNSTRQDALANLLTFISLRSAHESSAFTEAQRNTYFLRDEYLRRLQAAGDTDPQEEFDHWFERYPDGLIRVRPELDNHQHLPSIYIRGPVQLTP